MAADALPAQLTMTSRTHAATVADRRLLRIWLNAMFGPLVRLQGFVRRGSWAGGAVLVLAAIAACGSSKPAAAHLSPAASAESLLRQTFAQTHRIQSGRLRFSLTLTPSTAAGGAEPISIRLAGPFQSRGTGRPRASDLTVSISARGRTGSLAVISTGTAGYITAEGAGYQLPAASFQKLESSGIHPQDWVIDPRIVGSDAIGGVPVRRIDAEVDVAKLVANLSTLLANASLLGLPGTLVALPDRISIARQRQAAATIRAPTADLWTGAADRILRKLSLSLDMPVGASLGLGPIRVALSLQYSDVNRPQAIAAPAKVEPYRAFQVKLQALAQQLGTGTTNTQPAPGPNPALTLSPYAQCISNAAGDAAKMQACASLSNGASTTSTSTSPG